MTIEGILCHFLGLMPYVSFQLDDPNAIFIVYDHELGLSEPNLIRKDVKKQE